jgi:hypothetical protein
LSKVSWSALRPAAKCRSFTHSKKSRESRAPFCRHVDEPSENGSKVLPSSLLAPTSPCRSWRPPRLLSRFARYVD